MNGVVPKTKRIEHQIFADNALTIATPEAGFLKPTYRDPFTNYPISRSSHPGTVLLERFLEPLDIGISQLAADTNMAEERILEIIRGFRRVTVDTASRLSKYFGVSADFWLELQSHFDEESVPFDTDIYGDVANVEFMPA